MKENPGPSITKINLQITDLKFYPKLPVASELMEEISINI